MKTFFVIFSYISFLSLFVTCVVITYQIIKHGVGKTSNEKQEEVVEGNKFDV